MYVESSSFAVEIDSARDECEECVIVPHADVPAGMPFGSALACEDIPGENSLAAELFNASPLCIGIASVACGPLSFLMCHSLLFLLNICLILERGQQNHLKN